MISTENLVSLVRNTAPFLFQRDWGHHEFLEILQSPDPDYFALCIASHHATVATFVPTDVDSKIRGVLWRETRDSDKLREMADLAIRSFEWDLSFVSRRTVDVGLGPVSGHDGERMSVVAGAHGRFLEVGDTEYAEKTAAVLEAELQRELDSFGRADDEIARMKLAASIAHNLGDLNQGISFWRTGPVTAASRERFHKLGHESAGRFAAPMRMYRELLSPEGHRNYPLRSVKALRQAPELLLPQPPFLDDWGWRIAKTPMLQFEDRRDVAEALIDGCRKIPGQQGYYRALAGMYSGSPSQFQRIVDALPMAARREAQTPEFRKRIAVPRSSFDSMMIKRARTIASGQPARS